MVNIVQAKSLLVIWQFIVQSKVMRFWFDSTILIRKCKYSQIYKHERLVVETF